MRHPSKNSINRRKLFDFWFVRVLIFHFNVQAELLSYAAEADYL